MSNGTISSHNCYTMNEVFLDENTKEFSKLLFEIAKNIGENLWDVVKQKGKVVDNFFYKISSQYVKRFYQRYGYVQILGMSEPMSLENVFVGVF